MLTERATSIELSKLQTRHVVIFKLQGGSHIELAISASHILDLSMLCLTDAHLCLFGSSCNGFGFRNSDLDITLTFQRHRTDEVESFCCFQLLQVNSIFTSVARDQHNSQEKHDI